MRSGRTVSDRRADRPGQFEAAQPTGRGLLRHRPRIDRECPAQRQGTSRPRRCHLPPHRSRDVAGRRQLRPDLVPRMRARLRESGRVIAKKIQPTNPTIASSQAKKSDDKTSPRKAAPRRKARPQDRVWPCELNSPVSTETRLPSWGSGLRVAANGRSPFPGCQREYGCCVGVLTDALLGAVQD